MTDQPIAAQKPKQPTLRQYRATLRAHVQAKADAVVDAAMDWDDRLPGSSGRDDAENALTRACRGLCEARALLAQAEGGTP
jgi:hypothetical protein